ncbi:multidrug ABC transporter ATP-binding protein [Alkalicoccus urumqiensis]|uniref:Multidrug ABC transporter ATP-binding protein n=2 Tax=Alkalicoccus urumqiensis TaxID=1548213 RepID=A0A2P6MDY2_ALKUR|nr:ABC transporter ATP-binding protein [Alkalicoccus urumqiensis]PRO64474.1 multidrug ABC transporter ATP-binding protein [Alkalicoccus urumqiensis]
MIPHRRMLLISFLLLAGGTASEIAGPLLVQHFIDNHLTERYFPLEPLLALGGFYLFLYLSSAVMNYYQSLFFQKTSLAIVREIRNDVFQSVESLGMSFFDRFNNGAIISRITNDTEQIKELYITVLAAFVQNIFFIIGVFAAMFYLSPELALWCLAVMPVLYLLIAVYHRYSSIFYAEMSEKLSGLNSRLNESIQGMPVIQQFQQERRMIDTFSRENKAHYKAWMKTMKLDGLLLRPAVDLLSIAALMAVLGFFGYQSMNGPVEIGVLYAFVNYLDRMFEPVNQIMQRLSMFQQSIVSGGRVFRLMEHEEPPPKAEPKTMKQLNGSLSFEHVSFSYDGRTSVLDDVSFSVKKGEMLAVAGPTGSGKSTIINLIERFYAPDRGTIRFDAEPLEAVPEKVLRRDVGLVLQDSFIFSGSILDNIRMYAGEADEKEVRRAAEITGADLFIQKLPDGYHHQLGERGTSLSAGEKQLLSITRTVLRKPKILILDEATASVDTESEGQIQRALESMREHMTLVVIAHRLSTIKKADTIIVLKNGSILEKGTHESLLKQKGLYEAMYSLQKMKEKADREEARRT